MYKTTRRREAVSEEDISLPAYYFHQGTNYHAYECLGVHRLPGNSDQYVFRVWAPNAKRVSLISDFTDWLYGLPMERVTEGGIWECKCEGHLVGAYYKYRITSEAGTFEKADPYAFESETLNKTASIVPTDAVFTWKDAQWLAERAQIMESTARYFYPRPMYVYQMHLGSFLTRDGRSTQTDPSAYLNYREIAGELIPYLKQLGVTHVELLPIAEHSVSDPFGYRAFGFFAPTARHGTPDDFRYFVNAMHENNIGVLLTWTPTVFADDPQGLRAFDGYPLYEDVGCDGVLHFATDRAEVQSFLISNALFWMREYHVDGLRVFTADLSVAHLTPFLQKLNTAVTAELPDVLMIADGLRDADLVTRSVSLGGLGFHLKWNRAWSQDLYTYIETDPLFRRHAHDKITHIPTTLPEENLLLPISHYDVGQGQRALMDKHFGDWQQKFAGMRATLAYQMAFPGKKLLFMGTEFGQFREWDHTHQLEWFMLEHDTHRSLLMYTADLGQFYRGATELWEIDFAEEGFDWIAKDRREENLLAFRRKNRKGGSLLCFFNFSPVRREAVSFALPEDLQNYTIVWNSDDRRWGGSGAPSKVSSNETAHGHTLLLDLPGLSAVFLRPVRAKLKSAKKAVLERSTEQPATVDINM